MSELTFHGGEPTKCVMNISADKIWVDPDVEINEAAQIVISALENHIKQLVLAEREACAKLVENLDLHNDEYRTAQAIRQRGETK